MRSVPDTPAADALATHPQATTVSNTPTDTTTYRPRRIARIPFPFISHLRVDTALVSCSLAGCAQEGLKEVWAALSLLGSPCEAGRVAPPAHPLRRKGSAELPAPVLADRLTSEATPLRLARFKGGYDRRQVLSRPKPAAHNGCRLGL